MKSLGSLLFLAILAFYIAWPAYSGYEIKTALDARDAERLSAKIDFPSVRASLRPAVATKVEKMLVDTLKKAGPSGGPLTDELRAKLMPRIIDGILVTLVTPEALIRIHADGRTMKEAIDAIVAERANDQSALGGLLVGVTGDGSKESKLDNLRKIAGKFGIDTGKVFGGGATESEGEALVPPPLPPPPEPTPPAQEAAVKEHKIGLGYGLDNVKRFGLNGPLSVELGVAKNPKAKAADLTAEMSFIDGDWKLTGLVPRI